MCGCVPLSLTPFLSPSFSLSFLSLCVRFSKLSSWPARQWSSSLAHCLLPYAMSCLPCRLPACLVSSLVRLWSGGQLALSYICMCCCPTSCCQQQRRLQLPAIECGPGDQRPTTTTTTQMFSVPLPLVIPLPLSPLSLHFPRGSFVRFLLQLRVLRSACGKIILFAGFFAYLFNDIYFTCDNEQLNKPDRQTNRRTGRQTDRQTGG